jgi:hypothetical protein
MRFKVLAAANSEFLALDGNERSALRSARFMSGKTNGSHSTGYQVGRTASLNTLQSLRRPADDAGPFQYWTRSTITSVLLLTRPSKFFVIQISIPAIGSWRGAAGLCSRCSGFLRAVRFGVRNPVRERDFLCPTPVQTDPGAHPTTCTMDAWSLFKAKRLESGVNPLTKHRG